MFKHIAFTLALLCAAPTAKWDGIYLRGGASTRAIDGHGHMRLNFAGGYGVILPGYLSHGLYLGLDAELLNIYITLGSDSTWQWNPRLLCRIGAPKAQYLPYLAPSIAAYKYGEKHLFTLGIRAGVDFDFISPNFFWGVNLEWSYTLNATNDNFSILNSGFTFGYRF